MERTSILFSDLPRYFDIPHRQNFKKNLTVNDNLHTFLPFSTVFKKLFFLKANPIEKSFVDFTVRSCFEGKGDLYIHNKKLQFSIFVREWSQYMTIKVYRQ